jgi:aminoglycoside/choline kinase family phosphotransferase
MTLVADSSIPAGIAGYLDRHRVDASHVVPLTGDASDRRYFRIVPRTGPTFVLALHAAPFDYTTLPFVNVAELFAALPVPVPRVIGEAADLGVLALDDLGDMTLQAHVGSASAVAHAALYRRAVGFIEVLQRRGRELEDARYVPYEIAFDHDKLMWEMDFFVKHFLEGFRGVVLAPAARETLRAALGELVAELAAEPRVLCHRDYHSRNLMLRDGELHIIDFQDARMGPDTYDLASLLRDSYVDLPAGALEDLLAHFLALRGGAVDQQQFRRRFDVMALQRNLKALGTFGYQTAARGNPVYLQYIPRTLEYVRGTLYKYDRFARLRELLAPCVPEFRERRDTT